MRVLRRARLGGLIREYTQLALGDTVSGIHRIGADARGQERLPVDER